jgi:hypothetical protein
MPLPLVTFEQHMLFDDRPAYPMNCFIRLHFSGRLNLPGLQGVLPTVLARHCLLRALVRKAGRRQEWVPSPVWPTIRAVSPRDGERLPRTTAIDLRQEPGLRLWAVEGDQGFYLLMQFHHACCDAVGGFAFLEDLLIAYAQGARGALSLRALDDGSLPRRGRFASLSGPFLQVVRQKAVGLLRAWRFAVHTPMSLASPPMGDRRDALPEDYPTTHGRQLTVAESLRLRKAASRQGVTLNDLLMRDWFLAVSDWKKRHHPGPSGRWLRLCVPMNLRTEEHRQLPAANVISMAFVERRGKDLGNAECLLQGVHREMALIKRLHLGPAFVVGMGLVEKLPHKLLHAIGPGRCWASGVLTNLGVVLSSPALPKREDGRLDVDGAVLEQIDALPPLRPATHAAFTAFTYAGQLSLTLHYDSRAIERAQAGDLIDTYTRQLQSSMEHAGPSP